MKTKFVLTGSLYQELNLLGDSMEKVIKSMIPGSMYMVLPVQKI